MYLNVCVFGQKSMLCRNSIEDDLITFLYIARLDGRIDTQIANLTIGEKKRLSIS